MGMTQEAIALRRQLIIDTGIELFNEKDYLDITITEIAQRCGMAKGTMFNYFPSKESLFTEILYTEYEKWFDQKKEELRKSQTLTVDAYKVYFLNSISDLFQENLLLVRLMSIMRSIIERNIELDQLTSLQKHLYDNLTAISHLTATKLSVDDPGIIIDLYVAANAIITGQYSISNTVSPALLQNDPVFQRHFCSFEDNVKRTLIAYLDGMLGQ